MACLFNGQAIADTEQPYDRALHYGDGVFRTLAIWQGVALDLEGQLAHLANDAARLGIQAPVETLRNEATAVAQGEGNAVLKILVSRGSSTRGYHAAPSLSPNRYLFTGNIPGGIGTGIEQGVDTRLCTTRLSSNPSLAGIKHLNRLEQVLAAREYDGAETIEGLMLDQDGRIICGIKSNLFMVRGGDLFTPKLDLCGVEGRMRARVIAAAKQNNQKCEESVIELGDLYAAEEVFLTNSLIGIWPVTRLQNQQWEIGPLTRQLQSLIQHPGLS